MRTDVKIGIAVGVLVLLVAVIYVAATNKGDANKAKETTISKTDGGSAGPEIKIETPPSVAPTPIPPAAPSAPVNPAPSIPAEPAPSLPVTPVPAPTPITHDGVVPPTSDTTYTTLSGDTFYSVAQKKYGDGNRYSMLLIKANPGVKQGNIPPGTVLKLPAVVADMSLAGAGHPVSATYTVVAGDNLWKIAQKQYNDAKYVDLLVSANPGIKSESLRVGQVLTIPPKPTEADTAKPAIALPSGAKDYAVASGDNLTSISEKFYGNGKYWKQIASANPDTKDGTVPLKLGQKLVIPALKDVTPTSVPASLARSATTRPAVTPVARRTSPADSGAVSSTGSSAPARPDFSGRLGL